MSYLKDFLEKNLEVITSERIRFAIKRIGGADAGIEKIKGAFKLILEGKDLDVLAIRVGFHKRIAGVVPSTR